jgi:hypothetical protein
VSTAEIDDATIRIGMTTIGLRAAKGIAPSVMWADPRIKWVRLPLREGFDQHCRW